MKLYYNVLKYENKKINELKTNNNYNRYYNNFYDLIKNIENEIKYYIEKENYNLLHNTININENEIYKTYEIILFKKTKINKHYKEIIFIIPLYNKSNLIKSINFYYNLINKMIFNKRVIKYNISTNNFNKIGYKEKYYNVNKFLNKYNLESLINENENYKYMIIKKTKYYIFIDLKLNEKENILITINKKYLNEIKKEFKENNYIKCNNEKIYLNEIL